MSFTFMSIAVQWMTLDAKQKTKNNWLLIENFVSPHYGKSSSYYSSRVVNKTFMVAFRKFPLLFILHIAITLC